MTSPLHKTTAVLGIMLWTLTACQPDRRPCEVGAPLPNFIIIFCDDLGYGDIGPYGATRQRTPNLDRMAAEGMKFTSFYVASGLCTPSRAALLTGCYPRRVGLHVNEENFIVLLPGNRRGLNPSEITIAEILKQRGYATAAVGKWHLGDQPDFLPTRQGFDHYFGIPYSNDMGLGNTDYSFPPLPLLNDETVIETEPDQSRLTRRYTDEAVRFITENRDRPFFLYLPHTMPHIPISAGEEFRGKSANGIYGDAIEEIDWSTGRILETLRTLAIDGRTLVIFTSDNGAYRPPGGSNQPLRGWKGSTWEGGMREPCLMRWPGRIPAGTVCDELTLSMDLLPTLAGLAGAPVPADRVIDGRDIMPILSGAPGAETPHDRFYYYFMGTLEAVRSGKWKLYLGHEYPVGDKAQEFPVQLFDLEADVGETTDLAEKHPGVVERLQALAQEAREDVGDDRTRRLGKNTRTPGWVEQATPLTRREGVPR